ncbi:MAG: selenocysteine-specific translation elongation factor [Chloroflexota bacterium]
MYVIGTAGHVDHGKSTLVQALTGIDPDRLAEEKAREMTIDLGFAWLTLEGEEVGVVDVPGHRDFIENMLAGVGGIDVALFVVAADEGVMPQTREHLAILNLLDVRGGVIVLTKTDMIDDPDWIELVSLDVSEAVSGTVLEDAPIMPVSAKTGDGITDLQAILWEQLSASPPRNDNGRPRLPIDRIFSLSGFGTVVTGTLIDGRFQIGDPIELLPSGEKGRIRGLQTHKTKLDIARPGSRVAINISGIEKENIKRGNIIAHPDTMGSTILFDAIYNQLPEADAPIKHNAEVKLFVGATEVLARARIIGDENLEPGQEGFLQLATREPISISRGDRFIIRRPSPGATIGGGRVLDPHPGRRHRRFRPDVLERLKTLSQGTPEEMLVQALARIEPTSQQALVQQAPLDSETAVSTLQTLIESGQIVQLDTQYYTRPTWQRLADQANELVGAYHSKNPLRVGISREELRSRLRMKTAVFNPFLEKLSQSEQLIEKNAVVHLPNHTVKFNLQQKQAMQAMEKLFKQGGVNSPSVKDSRAKLGDDLYFALLEMGEYVPVSQDVVYLKADYENIIYKLTEYLYKNGTINAPQARDLLSTSRKYAIALLEHLDDKRITRRVGDNRELIKKKE